MMPKPVDCNMLDPQELWQEKILNQCCSGIYPQSRVFIPLHERLISGMLRGWCSSCRFASSINMWDSQKID